MKHPRNSERKNPLRAWLRTARGNAKRSGKDFDLELEDLPDVPDTCPVLGIPLSLSSLNKDFVPSLDRIDNSKGYVKGNVVFVSRRANRLKSDGTPAEFRKLAKFYEAIEDKSD